ncbi:unnamed protein product, partial [Amoebophrya sp. A25]|eukprot:GSA25T00018435001.1
MAIVKKMKTGMKKIVKRSGVASTPMKKAMKKIIIRRKKKVVRKAASSNKKGGVDGGDTDIGRTGAEKGEAKPSVEMSHTVQETSDVVTNSGAKSSSNRKKKAKQTQRQLTWKPVNLGQEFQARWSENGKVEYGEMFGVEVEELDAGDYEVFSGLDAKVAGATAGATTKKKENEKKKEKKNNNKETSNAEATITNSTKADSTKNTNSSKEADSKKRKTTG